MPPGTPVAALARLLADRGVSAAPVVEGDGRVLGIVTEADLIRRLAGAVEKPRGWLRDLLARAPADASRYARTHGTTARDVMTVDLVSVGEEATAEEIALRMEERGVKRVLVLSEGKLAGVVSRADLLEAVLAPPDTAAMAVEDARLRRAVQAAMQEQPWAKAYFLWATVEGGVVTFHGFCNSDEVARALRVLAEGVPGVRGVEIKLDFPSEPLAAPR